MATIAAQRPDTDGLALTDTAAAASQTFAPGDRVYLEITNGDASSHTATVTDHGSVAPAGASTFDADVVITVGAGERVMAGPFPRDRFADPATGLASITWSATTSMSVSVLAL